MNQKEVLDIIFRKNPEYEFLSKEIIDGSNESMGVTVEKHTFWKLDSNELLGIIFENSPEGIQIISIKKYKEKKKS